MMNIVKKCNYFRYVKLIFLLVLYTFSIIAYISPSSFHPEVLLQVQIKEVVNEILKMIMISVAINVALVVFAIGSIVAINCIVNKFNYKNSLKLSNNQFNKIKIDTLKLNLELLNPFLYGSKTEGLLE